MWLFVGRQYLSVTRWIEMLQQAEITITMYICPKIYYFIIYNRVFMVTIYTLDVLLFLMWCSDPADNVLADLESMHISICAFKWAIVPSSFFDLTMLPRLPYRANTLYHRSTRQVTERWLSSFSLAQSSINVSREVCAWDIGFQSELMWPCKHFHCCQSFMKYSTQRWHASSIHKLPLIRFQSELFSKVWNDTFLYGKKNKDGS